MEYVGGVEEECVMNIYVGNLSPDVTEEELRKAFEAFGQVASVNIIKDRYSGQPRGFGFVEMPVKAEAQAAITGLTGKELKGQALSVNEARPRPEGGGGGRRPGGGYGGRR
jgi:RNA recognition motif-containing protein